MGEPGGPGNALPKIKPVETGLNTHLAVRTLLSRAQTYKASKFLRSDKSENYWKRKKGSDNFEFLADEYDPANPTEQVYEGRVWVPKGNPDTVLPDAFDFENLKFIDPEQAQKALEQLEELVLTLEEGQKVALVIGTGGTLAMSRQMSKDGKVELVPQLDTGQILKFAGHNLEKEFKLVGLEFPKAMDSSQMCPDFTMDITVAISAIYNKASDNLKRKLSGFLVTHGTDTMAWSAADMAMALGPNPPFSVAFVGAQQTTKSTFTDVGINVVYALHSLAKLEENHLNSVMIGMGGTAGAAYTAVGAEKVSDTLARAFSTPGHQEFITWSDFAGSGVHNPFLENMPPQSRNKLLKPLIFTGYRPSFRVTPEQGSNPDSVHKHVINSPEPIVILESFGTGTVHKDILEAVMAAAEKTNKIVFIASPLAVGSLGHKYAAALEAVKSGAIPVEMMGAALAAKIQLGVTMLGIRDRKRFIDFIVNTNYAGEQFSKWKPKKEAGSPDSNYIGAPKGFYDAEWTGFFPRTNDTNLSPDQIQTIDYQIREGRKIKP
jgi:L-asparaginase